MLLWEVVEVSSSRESRSLSHVDIYPSILLRQPKAGLCGHPAQGKLYFLPKLGHSDRQRILKLSCFPREKDPERRAGFCCGFWFCSADPFSPQRMRQGWYCKTWQTWNNCVHVPLPICMNLLVSISVWEISEDTVWKCRNENIVSRCQNFLFSIFYSTWFWMECLYMFKWHCLLQSSHPAAWTFSFLFLFTSASFLSCAVSFLTIPRPSLLFLK